MEIKEMQETFSEFLKGISEQIITYKGIACSVALLLVNICLLLIIFKCFREKKYSDYKWRRKFGNVAIVYEDTVIPIENSEVLLGRHRSADIRFTDLSVSRYHAVLTFSDGLFLLDDLDSKSGTFLNGKKIKSAVVKAGDEIKLGAMSFVLKKVKDSEYEQGN